MILVAAPAGAAPPNEVALARHFAELGLIPSYATPEMALSAVNSIVGGAPRYELKSPLVQRSLRGKKAPLARFLARRIEDPSATSTYTTKALVLLVEFGDEAWPAGSPAPTGPMTAGPRTAPSRRRRPTTTAPTGRGTSRRCTTSNCCSATPTRSTTPPGRIAAAATRRCATTTSSSRTAPSPCPATLPDGSSSTCPSRGTAPTATRGTSPTTSPAPCGASPATRSPSSPRTNPGFPWADYDHENPYGITGDDFYQADGYVDHLILIHAGFGQADGGGAQDSDSIWSHSWGVVENASGGPGDGPGYMVPGTEGQGPERTGIWVYPYTINPEDGSSGVFSHEFGHDLGLPDQYDYSSVTGDASSGFWTSCRAARTSAASGASPASPAP